MLSARKERNGEQREGMKGGLGGWHLSWGLKGTKKVAPLRGGRVRRIQEMGRTE